MTDKQTETPVKPSADTGERFDVEILNRKVGTATSFDFVDNMTLVFEQFEPVEALSHLGKGSLCADLENGVIECGTPLSEEMYNMPRDTQEAMEKYEAAEAAASHGRHDLVSTIQSLPLVHMDRIHGK